MIKLNIVKAIETQALFELSIVENSTMIETQAFVLELTIVEDSIINNITH